MEFVLVTFPVARGVEMDGIPQGPTGQTFGVQRGHHVFDLGSPVDYVPASFPALVTGTTQPNPMVIAFQPAVAAVVAAEAAVPPGGVAGPPPVLRRAMRGAATASQQRKPKLQPKSKAKPKPKPKRVSRVTSGAGARRAGAKKATRRTTASRKKR
jgi:hypothetical protein